MVVNGEPEFNGDRTDEILNPLLVVEILLNINAYMGVSRLFIP